MKQIQKIPQKRGMIVEDDTFTARAKLDSRGRVQLRQEDRDFLGLQTGEMVEITVKRVKPAR